MFLKALMQSVLGMRYAVFKTQFTSHNTIQEINAGELTVNFSMAVVVFLLERCRLVQCSALRHWYLMRTSILLCFRK